MIPLAKKGIYTKTYRRLSFIETNTADHLPVIQALRFLAAAMVLFAHLNHIVISRPDEFGNFSPFTPVWWPIGVDIFFVISGFIMYHIAQDQFGASGASKNFLLQRWTRLVPPYWFFTSLTLVAMTFLPGRMVIHTASIENIIGSYLFIPANNIYGHQFPVLILGWTLNYEMMFYTIFAISLNCKKSAGLILVAAALLCFAAIGAVPFVHPQWQLPGPLRSWCNPIVLEFLLGIFVAMLRKSGVRFGAATGVGLIALGLLAMFEFQTLGISGSHWLWRFAWGGGPSALLVAGASLVDWQNQVNRLMRLLVLLGDSSFALYLSHPFALTLTAHRFEHGLAGVYIAVGFVACNAVAVTLHLTFEKPVHRWLKRRLPRTPDNGSRIQQSQQFPSPFTSTGGTP